MSRGFHAAIACAHCGEPHPPDYTHCPKTGRELEETGRALVGRTLAGKYRLLGLLGEGGMGAVYLAEHVRLGRQVAVKRLRRDLARDPRAVRRFQREARAATAATHHHIVEIVDIGAAEDGAPFIVMEYLRGRSLAGLLRSEGRLDPSRACLIVGQALAALAAVHERGIVHRDLKPDNVFLTPRGAQRDYVKLLDFGISKMRSEEPAGLTLTRTGVTMGTPYYMSPEQARGSRDIDHRVDLYAAGIMLYECLTGRVPFDGANYHQLLQAILAHQVTPPGTLVPLDAELEQVVLRAITKEPDERFASAAEMHYALVPFGALATDDDVEIAADPGDETRPDATQTPPRLITTLSDVDPSTPARVFAAATTRRFYATSADWDPSAVEHRPLRPTLPTRGPAAPASPAPASPPPVSRSATGSGVLARPPTATPQAARAPMRSVRGALVLEGIDYVMRSRGAGAAELVRAALRDDEREALPLVGSSAWASADLYESVLRAAERRVGIGDGSLALGMGEAAARRDLPVTQRALLAARAPNETMDKLPTIIEAYFTDADVRVETSVAGYRVVLGGQAGASFDRAFALAGFLRALLELAGAADVKAAVLSSRARGDEITRLSVRYARA